MEEELDVQWLEDRYCEGDPLRGVDPDLQHKDIRRKSRPIDTLLEKNFALVDQVFDEIRPSDTNQRIDEELVDWTKRIVFHVTAINSDAGVREFTDSELRILVWEMWYTDNLHGLPIHGQKQRHDGSSYSRTHLFESLLNGLTLTGITDLAFLLALLHHDDFEDLNLHKPNPSRDELTNISRYKASLLSGDGMDPNTLGQLQGRLFGLVAGVTNVKQPGLKRSSADKELESTKVLIERMLEFEPVVMVIRACERLHNLSTLDGMRIAGKNESANGKVSESLAHLAPIILSMGLRDLYKAMVEVCFKDSNPNATEDFTVIQQDRLSSRLGPNSAFKARLEERLLPLHEDPNVVFLGYRPKPFSEPEYSDRDQIFNKGYKPSEDIDPLDPLFRIEILVDDDSSIEKTKVDLISRLIDGPTSVAHEMRGVVYIYNPKLGGRVEFRVRSRAGVRKSQSGVLNSDQGPQVEQRLPKALHARYRRLKELLTENTTPQQVRELIREWLLQPTRVALTPELEEVVLPSDAVVLDLALRVHKQVLATCKGALRYDSAAAGGGRELASFDRVFPDASSAIDPMLNVKKSDVHEVSPSWVTYTRDPYTLEAIKELLRKKPKLEKQELGKKYCDDLQVILGFAKGVLEHLLLGLDDESDDSSNSEKVSNFHERVGYLAADPLELLANKLKLSRLEVEIDFPDEPNVLNTFLTRFGRSSVNLSFPDQQKNYWDGPQIGKRTKLLVHFEGAAGINVSTYDLLSLIYQISRVHPVLIKNKEIEGLFTQPNLEQKFMLI